MTNLVANAATDMTDWGGQFDDSIGSNIGTHGATAFAVNTSDHRFNFGGTGFTYSGNDVTGGVVHDLTIKNGSGPTLTLVTLTGFNAPASSVWDDFAAGDWDTLENLLFSGNDKLTGGALNDHLLGFGGNDKFSLGSGGLDIVEGADGNDTIDFGATLVHGHFGDSEADYAAGGDGTDTLIIGGADYNIVLDIDIMSDIEVVKLASGNDYTVACNQSAVGAGGLQIDGSGLGSVDSLHFGCVGTFGSVGATVFGGRGDDFLNGMGHGDHLFGGDGNDHLGVLIGNADELSGGPGDDVVTFSKGDLTPSEAIDGGSGIDTVVIREVGNFTFFGLGATVMANVEILELTGPGSFDISLADSAIGSGGLSVNAQSVDSDEHAIVTLDKFSTKGFTAIGGHGDDIFKGGSAVDVFTGNDGGDLLDGRGGADTLSGGDGANTIIGGGGVDQLAGGHDADEFAYGPALDSTGLNHDTITGFDFHEDQIGLNSLPSGVDQRVTHGSLSTATFNADMRDALAGHLLRDHAILFTSSNGGDFAGDTFLVIDENGHAGYQANKDIVILLNNATHLAQFDIGNFIGNT